MMPIKKERPAVRVEWIKRSWIDVNIRLPEKGGEFLVYTLTRIITIVWYNRTEGWHEFGGKIDDYWNRHVTHWMPLPEPPK